MTGSGTSLGDPCARRARSSCTTRPVPKARARRGKGDRHYTPAKTRKYEEFVGWSWLAQKPAWWPLDAERYHAELSIWVHDDRARDADNIVKSIQDGLNGLAWKDDRAVLGRPMLLEIDRGNPRVEVEIYAYGAL